MTSSINSLSGVDHAWQQQTTQANASGESASIQAFKSLLKTEAPQDAATPAAKMSESELAELRKHFREFAGNAMFGQALKSMRQTVEKAPYFHGGRTEEVFQEQLDQKLVEEVTKSAGDRFIDPMFELFALHRQTKSRS